MANNMMTRRHPLTSNPFLSLDVANEWYMEVADQVINDVQLCGRRQLNFASDSITLTSRHNTTHDHRVTRINELLN